jgi:hypothetical protein
MELNDEELTESERRLASALSRLAADASPERHAAIMSAVRQETGQRPFVIGRWRPVVAGLAAAAVLAGSTIGVFASSNALPNSPAYPVRLGVEHIRLTVASPADREHLRISFAHARISQANAQLSQGDRNNAEALLRDSRTYLSEAKQDLNAIPADEQGQIQSELNQTQADEQQSETQLIQEGSEGG